MAIYRICNIKLALQETRQSLPKKIEKACGFPAGSIDLNAIRIRRESLDARKKQDIHRVFTLDFHYEGKLPAKARGRVSLAPDLSLPAVNPGEVYLTGRPLIIGFGPCGIFAGLRLAEAGYMPLIIERGSSMDKRVIDVATFWGNGILNPESNVLFGEGGAGTFSDGKLTTGIKNPRIHHVLKTFVIAGAPSDIMYQQKPHIGTDILRQVVVNLRHRIETAGGEIRFDTCATDFLISDSKPRQITGVRIRQADGKEMTVMSNAVILAPGHSARDTFRILHDMKVPMAQKPFSIGVRMTHPQAVIDWAQYGERAEDLPPASYKLSYRASNGRGVYSFCMCPGGEVVTCSTQEGLLCVNGMSYRNRDSGTANAGILVDVHTDDFEGDDVLAGVQFQEYWEQRAFFNGGGSYIPPRCNWGEFRDHATQSSAVRESLPDFAVEALCEAIPEFGKKIAGFDADEAGIVAVETRSSSPVRILRGDDGQSEINGLYPAGEGAGYAGGIMSAACDGLRIAEKIIERFRRPIEIE